MRSDIPFFPVFVDVVGEYVLTNKCDACVGGDTEGKGWKAYP